MFPNFIEPLLYLAALGLGLGAFIQQGGINGQSYIQYIAPGLLASNAMFAASFESTFNTFVKLKIDRIYDAIITTPVNAEDVVAGDRKSTRLNSSHANISYAVFCLKKKKKSN